MDTRVTKSPAAIAIIFGIAVVLLAASAGVNAARSQAREAPTVIAVSATP